MTLGASVAVAAPITSIITEDAEISENPTAVEFNSNNLNDTTTKNSVGGIVVNHASTTTIKVTNDVTLNANASGLGSATDANAYGIYVGGDKNVIFKGQNGAGDADSNRILKIGTLTPKGTDGKAFAFYNAGTGTVTFNRVGLSSGAGSSISDAYGIFVNDQRTYNFGTGDAKTVFIVQGQNTTGFDLQAGGTNDVTLTGKLEMTITSEDGATPDGNGGTATGLSILNQTSHVKHNFADLDLTLTIKAGDGKGTGAGGDVIGIHRKNGTDITLKGGKITFKELVAGEGTGGQGKIYVIKNEIPNNTPLTLDETQIIVGSAPTSGHYGIYDNLGNTHYIFGNTTSDGKTIINLKEAGTALGLNGDTTLGGTLQVATAKADNGSNGKNITGIAFLKQDKQDKQDRKQSFGTFSLQVTGGEGGDDSNGKGGKGGNAIGILASAGTTITLANTSNLIIANGSGGSGNENGKGGNATGLQVNNATLKIEGTDINKIGTFKVGAGTKSSDATATSATAINLQGAKLHLINTAGDEDAGNDKALGITFDATNGYIYANGTNGTATLLQSNGTSSEFLGKLTVADNAIAGNARNILDNQGTLTLGGADFAGSIIVGTVPNTTPNATYGIYHGIDDTAPNAAKYNYNLGNLTINFGQEQTGANMAYGIYAETAKEFIIANNKTLTIRAVNKNISSNLDKFQAFGEKVQLKMDGNSNLILESNGGELSQLTISGNATIKSETQNPSLQSPSLTITAFKSEPTGNLTISSVNTTITNALESKHNANFTLDSSEGATALTLQGNNPQNGVNNAINTLTALGGTQADSNKLTIHQGATVTNAIQELVLGDNQAQKATFLTIENKANSNPLKIDTFTGKGTSTLTLAQGETEIKNAVTAGNKVSNTFDIKSEATLKLAGIFSTNGGTNAFIINKDGTLRLHNDQLKDGLITKNGTTSFTFNEGASVDLLNTKPIIAQANGKNIIDTAVNLSLSEIKADGGINNITLRGTTSGSPTEINISGAISGNGANNFTLDSTNGATTLTLNGNTNQITNFTALGEKQNTLTITSQSSTTNEIKELVLGDNTPNPKKEGHLTITNNGSALGINTITANATSSLTLSGKYGAIGALTLADGATLTLDTQGVIDNNTNTLIINTFTGNAGSTLTIGAKSAVNIGNLVGANNNITLGDATLTLNGGTLKSLTTTGTNNNINFASGDTTITSAINAGVGVVNDFTLKGTTGKKTSATFGGNISGTNNFKLDSATLHLQGNTNTITTLTLNNQSNNTINLAGDRDENGGINSRTNEFRLLTVGTPTPSTGTGLLNPNGATLTFESYINPNANNQSQTLSNNKATLGDTSASDASGAYGYAYSDRVIIHNAGDNKTQAKGKYQFKAYYANPNDLGSIKYNTEGGTEQEGNIALFTIAKVSGGSNQGIIEFDTQGNNKENNNNSQVKSTTAVGLSNTITTTLTQVATDQYGKTNVTGNKNYLTYFIDKVEVASIPDEGGDGGMSGGTGGNIPPYIKKSANLMIQSMAVSAVNLYLANFNSLNKRMGELRDNAYSKGVWARTFIGSQSNDFGLSDRTGYFSLQAGFDGTIKTEKANNFIGFAISYSKNFGYSSNQKNLNGIKGPHLSLDSLNAQLVELALYNSYVSNEGWYNDTIGKFSYIQNSMSVKDERKGVDGINGANAKLNTFAFTLSNEVGYRAKLGEDKAWFIDPQAELALGHINGMNFKLNHYKYPYSVSISSAINLRARAGASIGYDFKNFTQDKGIDAKVYVGAFYEMDSFHYTDGSKGIRYQSSQFNSIDEVKAIDFDHRAVLNVGTNLTIKDATRLYLDFEKSLGGKITTNYKINAGVRYSFGEALSEKGKEVLKDKESVESEAKAPLKLEEKDKQAKVEEKGEQDKAQG